MTENNEPEPQDDGVDQALIRMGAQVRQHAKPLDTTVIATRLLARSARRRGIAAGALAALVLVLGTVLATQNSTNSPTQSAYGHGVDQVLDSLGPKPINPTQVKLVADVQSFASCDALIDDLRKVGAQHVGSQGFGATYGNRFMAVGEAIRAADEKSAAVADSGAASAASPQGETLGTNVQVEGVDELDSVKAVGSLIYDLDGKGNLRITDARRLNVLATLDVTDPIGATKGKDNIADVATTASSLLVDNGRIVVFGTESDTIKPVAGDPSATQSSTHYFTVTFVDARDPSQPRVTDRAKVEGSLVAARLVGGQIRLVTASNMADIGMVMPTTPASVPIALERNRRTVAASNAPDWIPDWQRSTGEPEPLVPCNRVHVPVTFAGVAMTSMVTFPIGSGRFDPAGTAILAPSTTLYAGLDKVAISSQVWVDPIDRDRLKFDDWKTAIHEFTFPKTGAPTYVGSGVVDGSTVNQFAFGEVGDAIAVVTTAGTPWNQDQKAKVNLTLFKAGGSGKLDAIAMVQDLSDGNGSVQAVRYLDGRILVAAGAWGKEVSVIDVSNPAKPRRAGNVMLAGSTGYFHPLADHRALLIESRSDTVPGEHGPISRSWVRAELLDVANPDKPSIVGSWERPWSQDQVESDHHAFTYWPKRNLAMWGIGDTQWNTDGPNHAVVLDVTSGAVQRALPEAQEPPVMPAPCAIVPIPSAEIEQMLGPDSQVLGCAKGQRGELEWSRHVCYAIPASMVRQYAPDQAEKATYYRCEPAGPPFVSRVLVVNGTPILLTDQTLERLDPSTFTSTRVVFHPTRTSYGSMAYRVE